MNINIYKKEIITKRLVLKSISTNDINKLVNLFCNKEISKTYMIPDFNSEKEKLELANRFISFSEYEDTKHFVYGIYKDNELIGFINNCEINDDKIELGYVIDPKYWNNGYATEAVTKCLILLRDLGFKKVTAGYFEENKTSEQVMIRCGMSKIDEIDEITYKGVVHKCHYYGINYD